MSMRAALAGAGVVGGLMFYALLDSKDFFRGLDDDDKRKFMLGLPVGLGVVNYVLTPWVANAASPGMNGIGRIR